MPAAAVIHGLQVKLFGLKMVIFLVDDLLLNIKVKFVYFLGVLGVI